MTTVASTMIDHFSGSAFTSWRCVLSVLRCSLPVSPPGRDSAHLTTPQGRSGTRQLCSAIGHLTSNGRLLHCVASIKTNVKRPLLSIPHISSPSYSAALQSFSKQLPNTHQFSSHHEVLQPARLFCPRRPPRRGRHHGPELRRGHHHHRGVYVHVVRPRHGRQQSEHPELRGQRLREYTSTPHSRSPGCPDIGHRKLPRASATSPPPSPASTASSL